MNVPPRRRCECEESVSKIGAGMAAGFLDRRSKMFYNKKMSGISSWQVVVLFCGADGLTRRFDGGEGAVECGGGKKYSNLNM